MAFLLHSKDDGTKHRIISLLQGLSYRQLDLGMSGGSLRGKREQGRRQRCKQANTQVTLYWENI
jgi:hypothetical protein